MDSAESKKIFKEKGYLHFKNYFSNEQLDQITKISKNVLDKASSGKWRYKSLQRLS